jgi:hypothetical protein
MINGASKIRSPGWRWLGSKESPGLRGPLGPPPSQLEGIPCRRRGRTERRPMLSAVAAILVARPGFEPTYPKVWRPTGGLRALFHWPLLRQEPYIHPPGGGNRLPLTRPAPLTSVDFCAAVLDPRWKRYWSLSPTPGAAPQSVIVLASTPKFKESIRTMCLVLTYWN